MASSAGASAKAGVIGSGSGSGAYAGAGSGSAAISGSGAGAAAAVSAQQGDCSDGQTFLVGMGVAVGLGAGKETYDDRIKGTYFSGKDLVWDLLGGLAGSLVVVGMDE